MKQHYYDRFTSQASIYLKPSAYHIASTSWCSVKYFVRWSRDPVTMLTTPPGRSDVSNTYITESSSKWQKIRKLMIFAHLVQVCSWEWIFLTGNYDDSVATDNGRGKERHKGQQRVLSGTGYTYNTNWLIDTHGTTIQGGFLRERERERRGGREGEGERCIKRQIDTVIDKHL